MDSERHPPEPEWFTVPYAAAALRISERAVRNRIERGELVAQRAGPRAWIIHRSEIERWRVIGKLPPGPRPGAKRREAARDEEEGT